MNKGADQSGPKDEVLAKILKRPAPLKIVHELGSASA